MSTIHDLKDVKSISQMTDEELAEHLRTIRLARRTATTTKAKKKKAKSIKVPSTNNLSDEQLELLLATLEAKV